MSFISSFERACRTRDRKGIVAMRWLALGAIAVFAVAVAGIGVKNGALRGTGSILEHSVADMFREQGGMRLAAEIDLDGERAAFAEVGGVGYIRKEDTKPVPVVSTGAVSQKVVSPEPSPVPPPPPRAEQTSVQTASSPVAVPVLPVVACGFVTSGNASHSVLLNEIAWMGTGASPNDEWFELKNQSGQKVDIGGFELVNQSGTIAIKIPSGAEMEPSGFFLLERTDDDSVSAISADIIYTGALSNSGEWLKLLDANCKLIDEIDAHPAWEDFGGENATKRTLERNVSDLGWHTSVISGGTPRANNSIPFSAQNPPPPPPVNTPPPAPPAPPPAPPASPPPGALAHIVISEILAGVDGNADHEFIELYNPTADPVDLTGWELRKRSSSGSESNLVDNGKFAGTIPAHGYFLIASPAYTGAPGADLLYSVTSATLAYTSNSVVLYGGDHASAPVVDEVSWSEIPKNESYARDLASGSFSLNANPNPQNTQSL